MKSRFGNSSNHLIKCRVRPRGSGRRGAGTGRQSARVPVPRVLLRRSRRAGVLQLHARGWAAVHGRYTAQRGFQPRTIVWALPLLK